MIKWTELPIGFHFICHFKYIALLTLFGKTCQPHCPCRNQTEHGTDLDSTPAPPAEKLL